MEYSYNDWPASTDKQAIGIVDLIVNGHSFPGGCKKGDVHYLFSHFLLRYDARVQPLKAGGADEWGYAYRKNRNADNLSCHSSGTAVDVGASLHPNNVEDTFTASQLKALRALLAVYEGVIKWGGDFTGTKDEMHFEIHGDAADVRRVADKLRTSWFRRVLAVGSSGSDVRYVRSRLIVKGFAPRSAPGDVYTTGTAACVKAFQKAHGLRVTGQVDRATAVLLSR